MSRGRVKDVGGKFKRRCRSSPPPLNIARGSRNGRTFNNFMSND